VSARDEVLGRVRRALADAPPVPPVPRDYRSAPVPDVDVLALFADRVADYQATVVRCTEAGVAAQIAVSLGGARAVVPPDLPWEVAGSVLDTGLSSAALDATEAVVTAAAVGIAVTGTIVLDHGPGQGRRALSLVPDLHVCVVRADQVRYGVPDAVAVLDPMRPQTWISGPSATSDIELNRVEGVHGPRTLRVVLVG
jgi:L-lactate dehydrogenase complex protein LldG